MAGQGKIHFANIFARVPSDLVEELEKQYTKIKRNFIENRFEPAELDAAKLCEVIFRILEWKTKGKYTSLNSTINNFEESLRQFENQSSFNDSIRFHIPRLLSPLYTVRNKRGVGHVRGDVDPNHMDATLVVSCADWLVAELVRIFHSVSTSEAQDIVESLIEKKTPLVWEVDDKKRVLANNLPFKDKTLLLLYNEYPQKTSELALFEWVEHSNPSVFRRDVLQPLHRSKLVEYDPVQKTAVLSPKGISDVEKRLLKMPLQ